MNGALFRRLSAVPLPPWATELRRHDLGAVAR